MLLLTYGIADYSSLPLIMLHSIYIYAGKQGKVLHMKPILDLEGISVFFIFSLDDVFTSFSILLILLVKENLLCVFVIFFIQVKVSVAVILSVAFKALFA